MKRILSLLAAVLMISASSCAKQPQQNSATNDTPATTSVSADGTSVVRTVDASLSGKEAFEAIKKNYARKVVLIDFWATWCGPCRMAMKAIDEIKPELIEEGVAFVYVTGETSPEEAWQQMIPGIAGDHYRLTKTQWSEICDSMRIHGIPAYLLLNKDGSEAYSNLQEGGYPGNEVIQNNIEVALTK